MSNAEPGINTKKCERCDNLRPAKRVKKREWKGEIVRICVYCIRREVHQTSDLIRITCKPKCLKCGKKEDRSFMQRKDDRQEVKFFFCKGDSLG